MGSWETTSRSVFINCQKLIIPLLEIKVIHYRRIRLFIAQNSTMTQILGEYPSMPLISEDKLGRFFHQMLGRRGMWCSLSQLALTRGTLGNLWLPKGLLSKQNNEKGNFLLYLLLLIIVLFCFLNHRRPYISHQLNAKSRLDTDENKVI